MGMWCVHNPISIYRQIDRHTFAATYNIAAQTIINLISQKVSFEFPHHLSWNFVALYKYKYLSLC